ncbi:MAG TPA: MTAP family purine nucleoside phosphorylase [Methanocorpusculum sp.]|nr:MTAP family purine nucleoside phosphorylase [Methanocorpusculum sp.]
MNIVIMLGIIGGTAILKAKLPPLTLKRVATPFGFAEVYLGENLAVLKRHQFNTPPAEINHRANLAALKIVGVDRLILICSVGGMKEEYRPGDFVIASDIFSPSTIPTLHEHDLYHVAPSLDENLRQSLKELVPEAKDGVYAQSIGPRFETKAEIAEFAEISDVVGMTAASEITLANELEIPVAALCSVDNYANGVCDADAPEYAELVKAAEKNAAKMSLLIEQMIEKFA